MTIRLQFVNGYFYPTDCDSRDTLVEELRLERFPEERTYAIFPRLVKHGHKLAITDY